MMCSETGGQAPQDRTTADRDRPEAGRSAERQDDPGHHGAEPLGSPVGEAAGRAGPIAGQGGRRNDPAFPEELIRVTAWPDPVLDRLGHDPRSGYVERYWLPILGPSCLLLLRRLAAELEQRPDGFEIDTALWATELGIGMKGGKNGPFWRAVERGCRFGAAQRNGDRLAVRRRLPPLTARQVERLPTPLQEAHHRWTEARLQRDRRPAVVKWSPYRDGPSPGRRDLDHPLDDAA